LSARAAVALDGIGPREIQMERLLERAADGLVREVIVATSFTPEGDATAHYVANCCARVISS